jgi:hypothetical protein
MRIPEKDDLRAISGKTEDEITRWLKIGMLEYMFEGAGREAFPGAENFIDQQQGSVADDLAAVVKALGARDQETFRSACAIALRSLDFDSEHDALFATELLRLGAQIRALGLLKVLAEKAFRIPATEHTLALYELAFEVARDLADLKSPDAANCLYHLIRCSGYFRPALAGRALIALTEADPEHFAKHYYSLREALDQSFGYDANVAENRHRQSKRHELVEDILALLPDQKLLVYACKPEPVPRAAVANWWLSTLKKDFVNTYRQLLGYVRTTEAGPVFSGRLERAYPSVQRKAPSPDLDLDRDKSQFLKAVADALGFSEAMPRGKTLASDRA